MARITLRVLDGTDRGRTFENVPTPLTVGREEGNPVQLSDERISRFHLKIQEDQSKIILTDLESTNGTKVNGESVSLWILRPGDVILVGRTVLLFGSREQIARRLAELRGVDVGGQGIPLDSEEIEQDCFTSSFSLEDELYFGDEPDARQILHTLLPPDVPQFNSPTQAAMFSELLQYFILRLRALGRSVESIDEETDDVTLPQRKWQDVLDMQALLADYLRRIGEPEP